MKTLIQLTFLLLSIFLPSYNTQQLNKNVLVLLDNMSIQETHSKFFDNLKKDGFKLTFKMSDEAGLFLKKYGVWQYQHLVIFASGTDEFGGELSPEAIAEFVDNGGNVLAANSPDNTGDAIRDLAAEFGFEIDDGSNQIIDHINYHKDGLDKSGKHTVVTVDSKNLIEAKPIVGNVNHSPIIFKGSNLILDPANPLVLPILKGSSSAYSGDPSKAVTDNSTPTGQETVLIAGLQARNNARVIFSGSIDLFSNKFFTSSLQHEGKKYEKSGNEVLGRALSNWVFKMEGVLRLSNVTHHKKGEKSAPSSYTITDDVVYSVVVEEFDSASGLWKPFQAKDIQLEFVRIDPFIRTFLVQTPNGNGLYEAKFKIPDVYGVFQFKINYNRKGYTFLESATQVSVRPLQHTQYERFIPSAYPYYASSFSMMFGLLIFSFVFLHFKDDDKKSKAE